MSACKCHPSDMIQKDVLGLATKKGHRLLKETLNLLRCRDEEYQYSDC